MSNINWGIIGCGGIADRRMIPAMIESGFHCSAVMDNNPDVAKKIAEKYKIEKFYTDVQSLVNDKSVDAVYIATPLFLHKEQATAVLNASKHLLIEKPMAMNGKDSAELMELAKRNKVGLFVGYTMRYHNLHRQMRQMISEGAIGQVVGANFTFSCWYPEIEGAWRQKKMLSGGGAFMDLGIHCVDLFEFLTNEKITETKAFLNHMTFKYEVEDCASVMVKNESGATAVITANFNIPDGTGFSRAEVYGTKGVLSAEGTMGQEETGELTVRLRDQSDYDSKQGATSCFTEKFVGGGGNIYGKLALDFAKNIKGETIDYSAAESAAHIQSVMDKIYSEQEKRR